MVVGHMWVLGLKLRSSNSGPQAEQPVLFPAFPPSPPYAQFENVSFSSGEVIRVQGIKNLPELRTSCAFGLRGGSVRGTQHLVLRQCETMNIPHLLRLAWPSTSYLSALI